jgi:CMP/dCMP kinase
MSLANFAPSIYQYCFKILHGKNLMTFVVAIDGPAGTGKSSLARFLAQKLNYIYVDTGAIYRALAFLVDKYQKDATHQDQVLALIPKIDIVVDDEAYCTKIMADGATVENELRTEKISRLSSIVSQHKTVREALLPMQRKLTESIKDGAIFEGRDVGTVVFPKAPIKIFVTANSETRAERRHEELRGFSDESLEEVLREIKQRDLRDESRINAPMQKAFDAHVIDSSAMTLEEVINQALILIHKAQKNPCKGNDLW